MKPAMTMIPTPSLGRLVNALGGPTKVARLLHLDRTRISQAIHPLRASLPREHLRRLATLARPLLSGDAVALADPYTLLEDAAARSPSATITVPYTPGTLSAHVALLAAAHHDDDTALRDALRPLFQRT